LEITEFVKNLRGETEINIETIPVLHLLAGMDYAEKTLFEKFFK